jgi:hypothetical protein
VGLVSCPRCIGERTHALVGSGAYEAVLQSSRIVIDQSTVGSALHADDATTRLGDDSDFHRVRVMALCGVDCLHGH